MDPYPFAAFVVVVMALIAGSRWPNPPGPEEPPLLVS